MKNQYTHKRLLYALYEFSDEKTIFNLPANDNNYNNVQYIYFINNDDDDDDNIKRRLCWKHAVGNGHKWIRKKNLPDGAKEK